MDHSAKTYAQQKLRPIVPTPMLMVLGI